MLQTEREHVALQPSCVLTRNVLTRNVLTRNVLTRNALTRNALTRNVRVLDAI
jgi:hypothetical protein